VAELAEHPAAVGVAVSVGVEVADGVGELVGSGFGMRKHPLSSNAALLATTANSATGTSRGAMRQS
jgi:hypothetical protein